MSLATEKRRWIEPKPADPKVTAMCEELQRLQRARSILLKSRNMNANRIQAIVAGTLGYSSGMAEKDRKRKFSEATGVIDAIEAGDMTHGLASVVQVHLQAINGFNAQKSDLGREMKALAKKLPVAAWVDKPEQRGFGLPFLAIVIGETGNLSNYDNPGKLWKRLGCAPFTKDGETLMGATWRSRAGGKSGPRLSSEEWEQMGYSPRRRSIAYLIGEGIVKQNAEGPYRTRYDEAKVSAEENHPEWAGENGEKKLRYHRHGMLLATKLLLKNLWVEWNK